MANHLLAPDAVSTPARQKNEAFRLLLLHFGPPIAFLGVVFFFFPYSSYFEFSTDEGINLMKAMLVELSYPLYGQIWSDQPPLFTYILAAAFHFFGLKVSVARFVVLLFSALLLLAASLYTHLVAGKRAALVAPILLFMLPKYMVLSVSAMIGLPSIALAMLSMLGLALWHHRRQPVWLILSASALGVSVLIKLFTGFLAPIFVIGILLAEISYDQEKRNWLKILLPAAGWGLTFTFFTLGLGLLLVGTDNLPQLINVHLEANQIESFYNFIFFDINWHLQFALPVLILASIGTLVAIRSKRWLVIYPTAWAIGAYLLLYFHAPVWEHHQLLVTVPAVIPAAIAVIEGVKIFVRMIRETYSPNLERVLQLASLLGLFILLFNVRVPESISLLNPYPSTVNLYSTNSSFELGPLTSKFYTRIMKYAPETNWIVTDLPMYAFRAQLPVPPNLAVVSLKRVETGEFSDQDMIDSIRQWNPEQVLLGRFAYPLTEELLSKDYRLIHSDDEVKLYVRLDLDGIK